MEGNEKGLQDYLSMLRRRKWLIIVPFVVLFTASIAVAVLLPPVYRSSATILIEEPDVPRELVASTITGFADQRLQVINQRVMATQNLLEVIRKYDLYAEARQRQPVNEVINDMRERIGMDLISAEVRDPRSGRAGDATIAFKVWFEDGSAQTAQRVVNELVSLYLSENLRGRQRQVTETASFLANEASRLRAAIAELEKRFTELKVKHAGSLPEQRTYNLQSIDRGDQELRDLGRRAQTLQDRITYLQAELTRISPYATFTVGGQAIMSPANQLRALRTQLTSLSNRYTADHPDVVQLRRDISALEKEVGGGPSAADLRQELRRIEAELALARQRHPDTHPDVVRLSGEAAAVREKLALAFLSPQEQPGVSAPDNPAYIQAQSELQAARTEVQAIMAQQDVVRDRIAHFMDLIERTPIVEREYHELTRALDTTAAEYRAVRAKQMDADLGRSLETEQKGGRLSIVEPPNLPTEPIKPNRRAIAVLGFVLSAATGVGLAFVKEMTDKAVYSSRDLAAIVGVAPLAIVPYIRTRREVVRVWQLRAALGLGTVTLLAGSVVAIHVFYLPLDVLWAVMERRLEIAGVWPAT